MLQVNSNQLYNHVVILTQLLVAYIQLFHKELVPLYRYKLPNQSLPIYKYHLHEETHYLTNLDDIIKDITFKSRWIILLECKQSNAPNKEIQMLKTSFS